MVDSTNNQPDSNTAPQELALDIEGREQFNALLFVQTDANPGDLTVILPDNTPDNPDDNPQIVFPNYIALANAGLPPALTLADGTVIPGEDILALIEGLDYGKVAPAAGQQGGTNSAGGGAGFAAYTTEGLGDDLNHGPYAGGYVGPRVELGEDGPVYPDEDGSGGGGGGTPFDAIDDNVIHNLPCGTVDIPDAALRHNDYYPSGSWNIEAPATPFNVIGAAATASRVPNGTEYDGVNSSDRFVGPSPSTYYNDQAENVLSIDTDMFSTVGIHFPPFRDTRDGGDNYQVERLADCSGQFTFMANLGTAFGVAVDDWDGGRIWLEAGEVITLTNQTRSGHYWLAIDDDNDTSATQPAGMPQTGDFTWDSVLETNTYGESLSYTATADGWHYFGAGGVDGVTPELGALPTDYDYSTLVTITPVTEDGGYDYTANDGVLVDSASVAITGGAGTDLTGTAGADVLISGPNGDTLTGNGGDDVLIGRGGDDTMTGGAGRDLFYFDVDPNSGSLGDHDTITDFSTGEGDIINLDALFDALGVADGDPARGDVLVDNDAFGNAVLTIGDGTFTHTEDAAAQAAGFEITLDGALGMTDANIAPLIASGNLVVDES